MRTKLIFVLTLLTLLLFSSCTANAEENDAAESAAIREADIILLSDEMGLDYSEAAEIYELLLGTGISDGIKYVTAWNDTDTGESYYRVRTDTEKREVYLYSDGDDINVKITDGDIDYSGTETEAEIETEAKGVVTETEPVKEVTTEVITEVVTEIVTETEEITESAETVIITEPVTETAEITEEITEKVTEKITETEKEKFEIVLNKNTKKYHYPTCRSVSQMKEKNKETVYVTDISELFDMGYEPCGNCAKKDKR